MIPDPQNNFELLQNQVAQKIMDTSPFNGLTMADGTPFTVFTEDEGDIQSEFDIMIGQLGLCIVVHSPSGEVLQPDLPGPLFTNLGFDVWISQAPTFNTTGVRLWKAVAVVCGTLHLWGPDAVNGQPLRLTTVKPERERSDIGADQPGVLISSRVCHFIAPQVLAEVTT